MIPFSSPPDGAQPTTLIRKWWTRRAKTYRTESAVGLEQISGKERAAARVFPFTIWGVERLAEPAYLDAFYRTIDKEYGAFAALPFPHNKKVSIAPRVAACIRTIAAFSAWYDIASGLIGFSFVLAMVLGVLAWGGTLAWYFTSIRSNDAAFTLAIVIPLAVLVLVSRAAALLPRRWPQDALALLFGAAAFTTVAEHFASPQYAQSWKVGVVAAAIGAAMLCAILFAGIVIGQAAFQRITWRKISQFPEEEIVQSIAFLLTSIADAKRWRVPEERARTSITLEWIARRFQQNFPRRYLSGNSATDAAIATAASERGEAFRARKMAMAFPGADTIESLRQFLWDALVKTASNQWEALQTVPLADAAPRGARAVGFVGTAAAIALPLFVAGAVVFAIHDPGSEDLRRNVAITLGSWSLLSVLAILNPKQFEQQLTAAKTLGDFIGKKP
jgi:hypothetical protein